MKFILIMIIATHNGIATTSTEFESKATCEAAGKSIAADLHNRNNRYHSDPLVKSWGCYPK